VGNRLLRGIVGAQGSRFIGTMRVGQRLARQGFDQRSGRRNRRRALRRMTVPVVVIVIFEVFEDIADVQESVAIQPDIDEGGLHARKHAGHAALIDAADQRELFLALDVDFD